MLTRQLDTSAGEGPNSEQVRYWNEVAGPKWASLDAKVAAQLRPLGELALARAALVPGQRVLDVGCGGGDTTAAIARLVGPQGAVTGVDISEALLAVAERNARNAGLTNVRFLLADAQTADLPEAAFDVVFSRFGVMFFADPVAAFRNLRRALAPGGRFVFACWRAASESTWVSVPIAAAAKHIPVPLPEPNAPGPFALADGDRTRALLLAAGFADVTVEAVDHPLLVGGAQSLDETAAFLLEIGPVARALREAGDASRETVRLSVREAIAPHAGESGVTLGAAMWIVTARNTAAA